ncbi:hypothetical protein ACFPYJ_24630 [Paenibacillus solisilvae]|uniref:Uncharacterized protein n=1 Tax=Paenibacillus solisilvae TaxID=2486751 RepID=A0ABW0W696_9BACL
MAYEFIIEPPTYNAFEDEAAQIGKCKEWNLLSEKASKTKAFYYKSNGQNFPCSIVGYVDQLTAVIEFDNKQRHCIHPSYLKEMQASNYGQKLAAAADDSPAEPDDTAALEAQSGGSASSAEEAKVPEKKAEEPAVDKLKAEESKEGEPKAEEQPKTKPAKKEKAPKLQLPEEKVKFTATVKEFTTVPNHFADQDDEVVIYETVALVDQEAEVGTAWSSHSATLKKFELEVGDVISFEGKIVAKKLTKHPIPYKINNPGKLQKL